MFNIKATGSFPDIDEIIPVRSTKPVTACWAGTPSQGFRDILGLMGTFLGETILSLSSKLSCSQGNSVKSAAPRAGVKQPSEKCISNAQCLGGFLIFPGFWYNFCTSDTLPLTSQPCSELSLSHGRYKRRRVLTLLDARAAKAAALALRLALFFFSPADPIWE